MKIQDIRRRAFFFAVESVMLANYRLAGLLTRLLPPAVFYRLVEGLGALIYYSRPRAREGLRGKISVALGITDSRRLDRIGRGAYSALLLNVPDSFYWLKHHERFMEGLEVQGLENLRRADAAGKGVLIHMTHTGRSPLLSVAMAGLGLPFTLVMFHPEATPVPRYTMKMVLLGARQRLDPDNLAIWVGPGHDTAGMVREALAAHKRVGVPFDVLGRRVVDFFGRPAALTDGMARWAIETGVPIVPAALLRTKDAYGSRLVIGEQFDFGLTGDREADVDAVMRLVAGAGERMIREAPEQWMSWFGLWHWWKAGRDAREKKAAKAGGED